MPVLLETISFFLTLSLAFLLPGFIWWKVFFNNDFSLWEELLFSFLLSIAAIDTLMLVLGRLSLPLNTITIGSAIFLLTISGVYLLWKKKIPLFSEESSTPHFSRQGNIIFLILVTLSIFIRTLYLDNNILPTATDLGHHTYWAKLIAVTEKLPTYEKIEVVYTPETDSYQVTEPRPIADFIIGEHLPLAFFSQLSGLDMTSAFPILFLNFINILSVFAVVFLVFRLGFETKEYLKPEVLALLTLFFLGPLFALASPQAKFVSGGVVGNIFGNLFIPAIFLLFYRGLTEKRSDFIATGIGFSFILAFTHHLSTLILTFLLIGIFTIIIITYFKNIIRLFREWTMLLLTRPVLLILFFIFLFLMIIAVPTYLEKSAIDSAIGTPTKTTRTGLSFLQVTQSMGMSRMALGFLGILISFFTLRRAPFASAFFAGWGGMLLIMTIFPHWLFLDIPSSRIGSYLAYPLSILAALAFAWFLHWTQKEHQSLLVITLSIGIATVSIGTGSYDNAGSLTIKERGRELTQTIAATEYLSQHATNEMILKDHNYLSADAWMKLSFLRDYGFPLSRGLFGRYEEGGNRRERCTLAMISTPNTSLGEQCFHETNVQYLVVNPHYDSAQFVKSSNFSKVYTSDSAAIFKRND